MTDVSQVQTFSRALVACDGQAVPLLVLGHDVDLVACSGVQVRQQRAQHVSRHRHGHVVSVHVVRRLELDQEGLHRGVDGPRGHEAPGPDLGEGQRLGDGETCRTVAVANSSVNNLKQDSPSIILASTDLTPVNQSHSFSYVNTFQSITGSFVPILSRDGTVIGR